MARLVPLAVALIGLLLARGSTWTEVIGRPDWQVLSDFQILWCAGQGLAEGRDIHDSAVLDEIGRAVGRPATPFCAYNPLVVRAFGLFGPDFHRAFGTWMAINAALIVLAVLLLHAALRRAGLPEALAATVSLSAVLLNDGTWMNLFWNQMNVVALVAILAALLGAQSGRAWLEGLGLALAVCAKTAPALLVLAALLAGRRRAAAATLAVGAALFVVSVAWSGWDVHASYVTRVLPQLGYAPDVRPGLDFANNLSAINLAPHGLLARALLAGGDMSGLAAATWSVTALVLLALLVSLVRARPRRDPFGEYALGLSAMFLVSSVTWPHHLVLLAVPVTWLAARIWLRPRDGAGLRLAAATAVVTVALFSPLYTFAPGPGRGADMTGITQEGEELDMRVRTLALAALFGLLAWSAARPARSSTAPTGSGHPAIG